MITDIDLKDLVWTTIDDLINVGWTVGPLKDCQIEGEYIVVYLGGRKIKLLLGEVAKHSRSCKDFIGYLKKEIGK